ncbi:excalibur calcium-binding domain-containing protein [Kribbella sp. NPDC054772]
MTTASTSAAPPTPTTTPTTATVVYQNCDQVRAAGKAPLHRGDPGYSPELDHNGDGVACGDRGNS